MKKNIFLKTGLIAILVITLLLANIVKAACTEMKGVTYEIDVKEFKTVKKGSKKYGAILFDLVVSFKLSNYNSTNFTVLLGIPFLSSAKYKGAVDPKLVSVKFNINGKNIVKSAKLITKGISRVEVELSEPIGNRTANVRVVVEGMVKSTARIYVTKDYKLYKDYKPISNKILYLDIVNYYETLTWNTDKIGNETIPGLRIIVKSPPGWSIFYAKSSITDKVRYMDVKRISHYSNYSEVEFWYISTSTISPTKMAPGKIFSIEVGFQPISDYRNTVSATIGGLLVIVALFILYYYRDVWKYVTRKVG